MKKSIYAACLMIGISAFQAAGAMPVTPASSNGEKAKVAMVLNGQNAQSGPGHKKAHKRHKAQQGKTAMAKPTMPAKTSAAPQKHRK